MRRGSRWIYTDENVTVAPGFPCFFDFSNRPNPDRMRAELRRSVDRVYRRIIVTITPGCPCFFESSKRSKTY